MKPFSKELTDKKKFEEWRAKQGKFPILISKDSLYNLHWKLVAIRELCLCAKYLNEGWVPDWSSNKEPKYIIDCKDQTVGVNYWWTINSTLIAFKTSYLAQKAIEILGEDLIRHALSNDY